MAQAYKPKWDRGDGYDDRNPRAPAVYRCTGCDGFRDLCDAFCAGCDEVTLGYLWTRADAAEHGAAMGFQREAHTGLIHMGEAA